MGKNNRVNSKYDAKVSNGKNKERKNLTKKELNRFKYLVIGLSVLACLNMFYYLAFSFEFFGKDVLKENWYLKHCFFTVEVLFAAAIAFIMPYVNKYSSYTSNTKHDKYMYLLAIVLVFIAAITFIASFMG